PAPMDLRHFLGLPAEPAPTGDPTTPPAAVPLSPAVDPAETAAVRRIVSQLESMPPERARYLATFAYVLARAAEADMSVTDIETSTIERLLVEHAGVDEAQAVLVAEIAKSTARLIGGTEDYVVTREFVEISTPDQRIELLRACFVVGASDDTIDAEESAILNEIATELMVDAADVAALRAEYADKFSALQQLRRASVAPSEPAR
ncbi:MAG: TerB family tellurite resistance protein, partial [Candidatus Limnocylindrales bacterium]